MLSIELVLLLRVKCYNNRWSENSAKNQVEAQRFIYSSKFGMNLLSEFS